MHRNFAVLHRIVAVLLGAHFMTTATHHSASAALFPPLEKVTRPNLKTEEAAHYLNRRPQTLRAWASLENGPLRPRRVAGILAWSTSEIKALAGVPV